MPKEVKTEGRMGGSRGARGGRVRAGFRTRGGRMQPGSKTATALDIVTTRKDRMQTLVKGMPTKRMREVLLQAVNANPSMMFNILEPAEKQPGGFHPGTGDENPDWCVCGKCRQMPTEWEKVCCEKRDCLTLLPDFQVLILDEGVLSLARLYRQDLLVLDDGADHVKANRHAAYRQFVLWHHGRLGAGNRVVIPSCCVWCIRDRYPDPFGQYKGFVPNRLA